MEEGEIVDSRRLRRFEDPFETVLWQWQSGPSPDPWAEKDAAKWIWQDYTHDECLIIEDAFSLKKEVADLGNNEIDLKQMLHVNKQFRNQVRRVRRQEKSRFMMEMSEPVAVGQDQKTMNQAFGTIQHFLDYIMKRTPKAYGLYQRLKALSLYSHSYEFEDIIQEVVACIEEGAGVRAEILKTRSGRETSNFEAEAKEIVDVIKGNSKFLQLFLKAILKVYTMETFICYWLNELLRSENWEEMNVLTPYLVCLVYTFKRNEYIIKYQKPKGLVNSVLDFFLVKQKLYLFRGTALTKEHLELYSLKKIDYFSWNGVTSTSRERNVALNFIRASLSKAKSLNEAKVGVFFVIEVNIGSSEDCEGMIDVFQNRCSQYPDEQEVILAPGTVFKLQKTRLIEENIYEVSIKVKRNLRKSKNSTALLGSLQYQAIQKDKVFIDGLPSQEIFRLFGLLKGNKMIRKIEITNSILEEYLLDEIENSRKTTNVKRKNVLLRKNTIIMSSLGLIAHYFSAKNLNEILLSNKIRFKEGVLKRDFTDDLLEISSLILSEECLTDLKENNQLKELGENIISANQIRDLAFALPEMLEDSLSAWTDFLQCIKECKGLQSLKVKINEEHFLKIKCLKVLCQAIGASKTLSQFSLELTLGDEKLDALKEALEPLASIQNLSLSCLSYPLIYEEGLNNFKGSLISLPHLQHLSLDFNKCNISDGDIYILRKGFGSFKSLQHLSLNFEWCNTISDEGLNFLKNGLVSLKSLKHLSLNFEQCGKISNKGLAYLKSAFISLINLQYLSLNLRECKKISDEAVKLLRDELGFIREVDIDMHCERQ